MLGVQNMQNLFYGASVGSQNGTVLSKRLPIVVLGTSVVGEIIPMQSISFRNRLMCPSTYAKAARSLILTLDVVDQHPQLYFNKNTLRRAIYRFSDLALLSL